MLEKGSKAAVNFFLPKWLQMEITKLNAVYISTIKSAILWFLDTWSDALIIIAVWKCYSQSRELLQFQIHDDENTNANGSFSLSKYILDNTLNFNQKQSENATLSEEVQAVMIKCNLSDASMIVNGLTGLNNIFYKYFFQLSVVFVTSTCLQIGQAFTMSRLYWKARFNLWSFLWYIVKMPFTIIGKQFTVKLRLLDAEKERDKANTEDFDKEISEIRNRFRFAITEAFAESLSACRIQLAFYFAFSYFVGQEEYQSMDCIAQALLGNDSYIFTYKVKSWKTLYLMPELAFSALISLISISMAQYNVYMTRHEFDTTLMGKFTYMTSTILATLVKLATHTIFHTIILIRIIDPQNADVLLESFLSFIPTFIVWMFNMQVGSLLDWWMTSNKTSGYCLRIHNGYIWPTTTNPSMEVLRVRRYVREQDMKKQDEEEQEEQARKEEQQKSNTGQAFRIRIVSILNSIYREKTPLWYLPCVFPFMGQFTATRHNTHPDTFGFEEGPQSRINYRKRFSFTLGNYQIIFLFKTNHFQVSPLEAFVCKVFGVFCSPTSTTLTLPSNLQHGTLPGPGFFSSPPTLLPSASWEFSMKSFMFGKRRVWWLAMSMIKAMLAMKTYCSKSLRVIGQLTTKEL